MALLHDHIEICTDLTNSQALYVIIHVWVFLFLQGRRSKIAASSVTTGDQATERVVEHHPLAQ